MFELQVAGSFVGCVAVLLALTHQNRNSKQRNLIRYLALLALAGSFAFNLYFLVTILEPTQSLLALCWLMVFVWVCIQ